jgi:NTP pyrophosphatase (non-canonical NTP hydrolase)
MNSKQAKVQRLVQAWGIKTDPTSRALDLVSELGEVSKEILKVSAYGKRPLKSTKALKLELGDVYFSLLCLANALEIDLAEALDASLEKYRARIKEKGHPGSMI